MRAIVDIDDTLGATQAAILRYINRYSPTPYRFHSINENSRNGKDAAYQELVDRFLASSKLTGRIRPFSGSQAALAALKAAGWEVHIVSSRRENLHGITHEWLEANGLKAFIDEIHPRFDYLDSIDFKVEVARRIGANAAFEDTLNVAEAFAGAGVPTYLVKKPWNQPFRPHPLIIPSRNFKDGVKKLLG